MDKIEINLNDLKRKSVDKKREEEPIESDMEDLLEEEILNEGDIEAFGGQIQLLLQRMFGMNSLPVAITGSKSDIASFAGVMGSEKSYIKKIEEYGLNDPKVISDKYKLKTAINRFEKDTGISYPYSSR